MVACLFYEGKIDEFDMAWEEYKMTPEWDELPFVERIKQEAVYQVARSALLDIVETTVYYEFDKRLEKNWNLMLGANFQINDRFQIRGEYGALRGKQQLMLMGTWRFGL